jgi:hypothetical protein
VPNVARDVVQGAPCVAQGLYDFGLDSDGRTFVCSTANAWAPAGPLVGVRDIPIPCSVPDSSAQQYNGVPLQCVQINSRWQWAHRADTPGPPRCFSAATSCLGQVPAETPPILGG